MSLRSVAAAAACIVSMLLVSQAPSRADGMPAAEDENYNPVPAKPGVPAPGVTQPPPIKPAKPAKPVATPKPAKPAVVKPTTPLVAPAPATPAPAAPTPAPDLKPAPVPATEPAPVPQPAAPPVTTPPPATPPVTTPAPAAPVSTPAPETPAATPATPAPTDPAVIAGKKPVFEIINVDVQVAERQPPFATVLVKGTARTGGWKNMELRPLQTFAPEVGMRSFTLVGTPPDGPATQAITTVTAAFTIDPLPADVKTIRVLAETNEGARTFR